MKKHKLIIKSLRDIQADCLCGSWHLSGTTTPRETDNELKKRILEIYKNHLK